jgi:phosphatidylserine decarboxylase
MSGSAQPLSANPVLGRNERPDDPAPPIARAGWPFLAIAGSAGAALSVAAAWAWSLAIPAGLAWVGLIFCAWFFRDPQRVIPADASAVVSPADGVVLGIDEAPMPEELAGDDAGLDAAHLSDEARMTRVAIFLNVFNVHVNRVPLAGEVLGVAIRAGGFAHAGKPQAAHNRRCSVAIRANAGTLVVVSQVTGWIARRIVCHARKGEHYRTGQRYGLIRFGSRTDVYLPRGTRILVAQGQKVVGGQTILARLPG